MRRRDFIALAGAAVAAAWPAVAHAQQRTPPVIGYLAGGSPTGFSDEVTAFRTGLRQTGLVDGQDVRIEYRWANGHYDQMPALATDLAGRNVAVIFASGGDASARAAKAATNSIPVVFIMGGDPVAAGLVASLSRPGGNITGVTLAYSQLEQKRFELLHQMIPKAAKLAVLMNPNNPRIESDKAAIQAAAKELGLGVIVVYARQPEEIEGAVTNAIAQGASAIDVAADPLFFAQRERLVATVAKQRIPAMYQDGVQVTAGGLMSYGTPLVEVYRQAGIYTGQVLKGTKPSDLPVFQPSKYELHINLKTAKSLGLEVPTSLLLLANKVIE